MVTALPRRTFLTGATALGMAACTIRPGSQVLGHTVVGSGPETVVALHEWLGDHGNYDNVQPYLSGNRARYVFADLRGYGLSRGMAGHYSLEETAADVLALMDSLDAPRFHVVGHSMSGMTAQYLAMAAPERIKSVVAISPVPATGFKADGTTMAKLKAIVTDDDSLRAAVTARTGNRYGRPWLERKLALARRAEPAAMLGYLDMFTGSDFAARLTGCPISASLIVGAHDIPFYGRAALEPGFRQAFARLDVAVVAEAGHYSMVETPVLVAALIERAVLASAADKASGRTVTTGGAVAMMDSETA